MPPALHACAAKQVVSSPVLLCRARQSPLAESFMQRMHPAKFPARLELYLGGDGRRLSATLQPEQRALSIVGRRTARPSPNEPTGNARAAYAKLHLQPRFPLKFRTKA